MVAGQSEKNIIRLLDDESQRSKVFSMIVSLFSERLYWKIRSIVLSHEDANDILQNTFLKAWKNIHTFQGRSQLSTWLYRIAINESLDFLRHQKAQHTISSDNVLNISNQLMADDYFDGDKGQALLQEAIATLPDVQRVVFTLRYFDEMKYAEMSKILQTSEGGLKASYHIAVKKITQYIQNNE